MPELPEVETVKNTLKRHLLNRKIISVDILYRRMILTPIDEFVENLKNVTIKDILRKGKYLIFNLDEKYALISHLRMEGKYLYFNENDDNTIHARVVFHLDNNEKMIYDDSRCFGIMELHPFAKFQEAECLMKLGPEPFDCNGEYLFSKLRKKQIEIKSAILDQTILSGLGNIYADETLFASKINPYRKASSITLDECNKIISNSIMILNKAIKLGGSTVSSYHPENGVDGKFQNELLVYGKKGQHCPICHHKLLKDFCNGRGTTYCPNCQNVAIRVGIYGKIASGKSTMLTYLSQKGYKIFSCDEYINDLYLNSLVLKKALINLFKEEVLNDDGTISKSFIKNKITTEPSLKLELEKIIHPLVKKGIEKFIANTKEETIIFIEIPLLFEAKMTNLVDYIIGLDASLPSQIRNLENRGSKNPMIDLKLNQSNQFDKYAPKCDYIISNNSSLDNLYSQVDETLNKIINQ